MCLFAGRRVRFEGCVVPSQAHGCDGADIRADSWAWEANQCSDVASFDTICQQVAPSAALPLKMADISHTCQQSSQSICEQKLGLQPVFES